MSPRWAASRRPTGGDATIVSSDDGVIGAADQIGEDLRHQYVIGFAPGASRRR